MNSFWPVCVIPNIQLAGYVIWIWKLIMRGIYFCGIPCGNWDADHIGLARWQSGSSTVSFSRVSTQCLEFTLYLKLI